MVRKAVTVRALRMCIARLFQHQPYSSFPFFIVLAEVCRNFQVKPEWFDDSKKMLIRNIVQQLKKEREMATNDDALLKEYIRLMLDRARRVTDVKGDGNDKDQNHNHNDECETKQDLKSPDLSIYQRYADVIPPGFWQRFDQDVESSVDLAYILQKLAQLFSVDLAIVQRRQLTVRRLIAEFYQNEVSRTPCLRYTGPIDKKENKGGQGKETLGRPGPYVYIILKPLSTLLQIRVGTYFMLLSAMHKYLERNKIRFVDGLYYCNEELKRALGVDCFNFDLADKYELLSQFMLASQDCADDTLRKQADDLQDMLARGIEPEREMRPDPPPQAQSGVQLSTATLANSVVVAPTTTSAAGSMSAPTAGSKNPLTAPTRTTPEAPDLGRATEPAATASSSQKPPNPKGKQKTSQKRKRDDKHAEKDDPIDRYLRKRDKFREKLQTYRILTDELKSICKSRRMLVNQVLVHVWEHLVHNGILGDHENDYFSSKVKEQLFQLEREPEENVSYYRASGINDITSMEYD